MPVYLGTKSATKIYLGITEVKKVYVGNTLFYSNKASYSDNFDSYTNNYNLADSAVWNAESGAFIVLKPAAAGTVRSNTGGVDTAIYYTGAVANNQYSQITVTLANVSSTYIGVAVRIKGDASGTYYSWYGSNSDCYLQKFVNGAWSATYGVGDAFAVDDIIKLQIVGNELQCYRNGGLDTSVVSGGKITDSSSPLTTGYVGLSGYNDNDMTCDLWLGGDI